MPAYQNKLVHRSNGALHEQQTLHLNTDAQEAPAGRAVNQLSRSSSSSGQNDGSSSSSGESSSSGDQSSALQSE